MCYVTGKTTRKRKSSIVELRWWPLQNFIQNSSTITYILVVRRNVSQIYMSKTNLIHRVTIKYFCLISGSTLLTKFHSEIFQYLKLTHWQLLGYVLTGTIVCSFDWSPETKRNSFKLYKAFLNVLYSKQDKKKI